MLAPVVPVGNQKATKKGDPMGRLFRLILRSIVSYDSGLRFCF